MIVVQKTPKFGCLGFAGPAPKASKKTAAADDEIDLFGDSDEEAAPVGDAKAQRAAAAAAAKAAADAKKAASKPKKIDKSLVVLVVKPWESETDLDELWGLIKATKMEGLSWGQNSEKEPLAYGIFQLKIVCTVVDDLVMADDITDLIEQFEDHVQSVQMLSMNKIS
jgi:translation elongation factor EF-1beta